ncbi:MAG: flagellar export chaperone FliS [Syntrophomonadaceae bacterium]|jgi:flagellar protein FliS
MAVQIYDQYRKTTVETMTPAKLLLMLYDGALNSLRSASKAVDEKDMSVAHNQLIKGQDIVAELMSTLNMEYDISHQLYALYDYMFQRLVEANTTKDKAIIEEVYQFLSELRDTFAQAADEAGRPAQPVQPMKQLNITG